MNQTSKWWKIGGLFLVCEVIAILVTYTIYDQIKSNGIDLPPAVFVAMAMFAVIVAGGGFIVTVKTIHESRDLEALRQKFRRELHGDQ